VARIVSETITAGVNFGATAWRAEFSGAEWSMRILLRGPAAYGMDAERDAARHVWSVSAAETAEWIPGEYAYQVRAYAGDEAHVVEEGRTRIIADFAALPEGHDPRSENRRALDAINAVLAKRATLDQERYRINNRELYRMSVADLLRLRAHFVRLVRAEERQVKGGRTSWLQVKFTTR